MDCKDREPHDENNNRICRLEWIALAMEAARQHRETPVERSAPSTIVPIAAPRRDARES